MESINELYGSIHTQLLDSLPDAVAWLEPVLDEQQHPADFRFSYCNQKVYEMAGDGFNSTVGELLVAGNKAHATFANALFRQYVEVYETGKSKEYTYQNPLTNTYASIKREFTAVCLCGQSLFTGASPKNSVVW